MSRTVLIHLNVAVNDDRSVDEVVLAVSGALEVGTSMTAVDFPCAGLEIVIADAEEL